MQVFNMKSLPTLGLINEDNKMWVDFIFRKVSLYLDNSVGWGFTIMWASKSGTWIMILVKIFTNNEWQK